MPCSQAGRKGGFLAFRELKAGEGVVDLGLIAPSAAVFKANTQRAAIQGESGESKTPALSFSKAFAQLAFITDRYSCLFQGIQKFIERLCAQTTHLSLQFKCEEIGRAHV